MTSSVPEGQNDSQQPAQPAAEIPGAQQTEVQPAGQVPEVQEQQPAGQVPAVQEQQPVQEAPVNTDPGAVSGQSQSQQEQMNTPAGIVNIGDSENQPLNSPADPAADPAGPAAAETKDPEKEVGESDAQTDAQETKTAGIPAAWRTADTDYGKAAYEFLKELTSQYPKRTNENDEERSEAVDEAGRWIKKKLESFGYEVQVQQYTHHPNEKEDYKGINYYVTKPGKSKEILCVGAHYDCVDTEGADDNGSGVSVLLELAKRFYMVETPYTLVFAFFDNEEYGGYVGSYQFVEEQDRKGDLKNYIGYINLDSVGAGDRLFAYGGVYRSLKEEPEKDSKKDEISGTLQSTENGKGHSAGTGTGEDAAEGAGENALEGTGAGPDAGPGAGTGGDGNTGAVQTPAAEPEGANNTGANENGAQGTDGLSKNNETDPAASVRASVLKLVGEGNMEAVPQDEQGPAQNPGGAADPADAGAPANAEVPADAGAPADAEAPANPEVPADAGAPANAEVPVNAETPAAPAGYNDAGKAAGNEGGAQAATNSYPEITPGSLLQPAVHADPSGQQEPAGTDAAQVLPDPPAADNVPSQKTAAESEEVLMEDWLYKLAQEISEGQLYTIPEGAASPDNEIQKRTYFKPPTRIKGSDHYYFMIKGIPYVYFEAALWCNDDGSGGNEKTHLTCHYQTADPYFEETGGQIMHTKFDDFELLEKQLPGRLMRNMSEVSRIVSKMLFYDGALVPGNQPQADTEKTPESVSGQPEEKLTEAENENKQEAVSAYPEEKKGNPILPVAAGAGAAVLLGAGGIAAYQFSPKGRRRRRYKNRLKKKREDN